MNDKDIMIFTRCVSQMGLKKEQRLVISIPESLKLLVEVGKKYKVTLEAIEEKGEQ